MNVMKVCGLLDSWLSLILLSAYRDEPKFGSLKALSLQLRNAKMRDEQVDILQHMQMLVGFGMGSLYDIAPSTRPDIQIGLSNFELYKAYIDQLNLVSEEIKQLLPW